MTTYYVATTGSDANPGTEAQPFLTIQEAVDNMVAGDTCIVEDGTYSATGAGERLVETFNKIGSSGARFTIQARNRHGAILDGAGIAETAIRFNSDSTYWTIDGLSIRNFGLSGSCAGITLYGTNVNNIIVRRCKIDEIGNVCSDTTNGMNGVFIGAPSGATTAVIVEECDILNIGRYAEGENGCTNGNTAWQNHDHGIYVAEANDVLIRNNTFVLCARGWAIQRFNTGGHNTIGLRVLGNTFAFENPNRDGHIIIATSTTDMVVENNTFYDPRGAGLSITGGTHVNGVIRNNCTFGGPITTGSTTGFTLSNNLNATDPQFVNSGSTPDMHLQSTSPCRGAGVANAELTTDYDGVARSSPPDIGAFQFVDEGGGGEEGNGTALAGLTRFTAVTGNT